MRKPLLLTSLVLVAACKSGAPNSAYGGEHHYAPLRKVRVYDSGIAYFERRGRVDGDALALPVPRSHLDDAVATLVVLASDGTKVTQIGYPVPSSPAKARAWLGLDGKEAPTLRQLLAALRGERVRIESAERNVEGVLLSVTEEGAPAKAPKAKKADDEDAREARESAMVLVQESDGAVVRLAEQSVRRVMPLDPATATALSSTGQALAPHAAQLRTTLTAAAHGGELTFGYVSESPAWKMSYRLVMEGEKGRLVGYAAVHNDTDEAWEGVHVELSNGQPDSFIAAQASPTYRERRVASRPEGERTVGQLETQSPDELAEDARSIITGEDTGDSFGSGGLGLSGSGTGGGGSGHGSMSTSSTGASSLLSIGNLAEQVRAKGVAQSNLYTYVVQDAVSLPARHSALLPVLSSDVVVQRVHLFSGSDEHGMHAAYLVNSSGLTLPPGTVALFADGGYAGENQVDRMLGGATRYLSFAPDLDVTVTRDRRVAADRPKDFGFDGTRLHVHSTRVSEEQVHVKNPAAAAFVLATQVDAINNARIEGAKKLTQGGDEGDMIVQLDVPAAAKYTATLMITEGVEKSATVESLSAAEMEKYIAAEDAPSDKREVLRGALALLRESTKLQADMARAQSEDVQLEAQIQALSRKPAKTPKTRKAGKKTDEDDSDARSPAVEKLVAPLLAKRAKALAQKQEASAKREDVLKGLRAQLAKLPKLAAVAAPQS